jgi:hypothetical protein
MPVGGGYSDASPAADAAVPGPENASCGIGLRDAVRCVAMVGARQRAHPFSCHLHDGRSYDMPARFWNNQRVSSVRDLRPVFVRILRTWLSTVRSERTNLLATSRFDKA